MILEFQNTFITYDIGVVSDFERQFLNSKKTQRGAEVGLFLFSAHASVTGYFRFLVGGIGVVFSVHKEMG